jgi:N-acetylmuramic acid 6-phosphate etherase
MKLLNEKMLDRSVKMLMETAKIHDYEKAKEMLLKHGSVKQSLDYFRKNTVS